MPGKDLKLEYKHILFVEQPIVQGRQRYTCRNKKNGGLLGQVEWYGPWRKYIFWPNGYCESVFGETCLRDIIHFLNQLKE